MPASREALEAHQVARQAFGDRFAEGHRHDGSLAAHDQHRAANVLQSGSIVHAALLVARSVEPERHLVLDDAALQHVGVFARSRTIEGKADLDILGAALGGGIEPVGLGDSPRVPTADALEAAKIVGKSTRAAVLASMSLAGWSG